MPEHLLPTPAEPAKRGPKPSGTAMNKAERQRKSRAARRAATARRGAHEGVGLGVTGFLLY
jgi:hypothetical protein